MYACNKQNIKKDFRRQKNRALRIYLLAWKEATTILLYNMTKEL